MSGRQIANMWWYLFGTYGWSDGIRAWRGWSFFKYKIWTSEYFWHDTFGRYWSQFTKCRNRLNCKPQRVNDDFEGEQYHCFCCERPVNNEIAIQILKPKVKGRPGLGNI